MSTTLNITFQASTMPLEPDPKLSICGIFKLHYFQPDTIESYNITGHKNSTELNKNLFVQNYSSKVFEPVPGFQCYRPIG